MLKIINKEIDWVDAFLLVLWVFAIMVVGFIGVCNAKTKFTHQYSLGGDDGALLIIREVDWCEDDEIQLDRNVTYWDAIRMVDSLNQTIKK